MPSEQLLSHPVVRAHESQSPEWDDRAIDQLTRHFAISREAVLRRLLTHGLTTASVYERKRAQYQAELDTKAATTGGFVTPPVNAVSKLGRTFVRLVLENFDSGNITSSDVSDYLGLRLKHLPAVAAAVDGE